MISEIKEIFIELRNKLLSSRLFILGTIYAMMVLILLSHLFRMQIVDGEEYQANYIQKTEKTVSLSASRGNIYDVNGNLLAYNTLAYGVTVTDNGYYTSYKERNQMLYRLVQILNKHGETIIGDFAVGIDGSGEYFFTGNSENSKKRFLTDIYGLQSIDELDDSAGKYPSTITAKELVELRYTYYGLDELTDDEGNLITLTDLEKLELINIRYTMGLKAYRRYEVSKIASSISESTKADILENQALLVGVEIEEETLRVYNDSIYFSSIIGYIGKVADDQLKTLQAQNPSYTATDIVGRSGIEEYMETTLQGIKGTKTLIVDNVGHVMETVSETTPVAGNNVYLTIDRDLQVGVYHLIEQQLAGILAGKLVHSDEPNTETTDSTDRLIPIKDAYFQLINNNVLDILHFSTPDATEIEKNILEKFVTYRTSNLSSIRSELISENALAMGDLSTEQNAYMYYIYTLLSTGENPVIQTAGIDVGAAYYEAWKSDTLSLRDLLYAGIAGNWIDTTNLNVESAYSDADDIYAELVEYIIQLLQEDTAFEKLNYKYLIQNNILTGRELCLALFDQGLLASDEESYQLLLANGENYAYTFFVEKVSNIEITPAQLALDPCTAGVVITDVNTGEVRALVSYPGYDNNRLTNTMDAEYFDKLLSDQSLPLYNNATQTKKAPGSTFKPISAIAALEEGVVTIDEVINCTGIYDTITPALRCWVFPGSHGNLSLVGAIQNSCNVYFAEVAHRLSTNEVGEYDATLGIKNLEKYASLFGLDHKTGIEIVENEPEISDSNPESSAIGQGTHSFTNISLSRYVTSIANEGSVYSLSLLDKVTDAQDTLVTDYTPTLESTISLSQSTWDNVKLGMERVVSLGSARRIFSDLEVEIAGKTGTAQESKNRANHAFFISFAPYSNPEIAVTVNIPYGYSSSNAATVAKNIYKYYFGYTNLDYILSNGALDVSDVKIGD